MIALVSTPALLAAEASSGGMSGWITILISLIVALGGGGTVAQLMLLRSNKRSVSAGTEKMKIDAVDVLSDTALSLVLPLKEQVDHLSNQVKYLEQRLEQERETADTRIRQLESDIFERDRHIHAQSAEISQLRTRIKSHPGWPDQHV